jgi:hypothetical protein
MIPAQFQDWKVDSSGYRPSTKGGKLAHKLRVEDEIKRNLFADSDHHMEELAQAHDRLESSMANVTKLQQIGGQSVEQGSAFSVPEQEDADKSCPTLDGHLDTRFHHSWTPSGLGSGWFWIPKGCLDFKSRYPASFDEVRHFGYAARQVRVLAKPLPLSKSFARVVAEPRMVGWDPGCQAGKRRQEEWMDEDDLLGGDLGEERDLRRQL